MSFSWNAEEKNKIAALLKSAKITGDVSWYKKFIVPKIINNKDRYKLIADEIGCPMAMVALIHAREMGSDLGVFRAYLGNGQPLNKKTTIVPIGRGPFLSWESGAIDALRYEKIDQIAEWSLERMFFELEAYNGMGYRSKGINSPYVYSLTNHYSSGRYVSDGVFSRDSVDKNIGCLALYRLITEADRSFIFDTISDDINPDLLDVKIEAGENYVEYIKKIIIFILQTVFGLKPQKEPEAIPDPSGGKMEKILKNNPLINPIGLEMLLRLSDGHKSKKNDKYLTLVDMNKYDYEPRMHLINMESFESESFPVAHGSGSDTNKDNRPDEFSNLPGSYQTSLGLFAYAEEYVSSKRRPGVSFELSRRLDGLTPGMNDKMRERGVVLHDAELYVNDKRVAAKNVGDSQGCLALSLKNMKKINPLVAGSMGLIWDDTLKI